MAIKIDLEKAYDRLNWGFINIGCPDNIVDIIWWCIPSPSMHLLWNGEALQEFSPKRGIRQGCPLSPYLFILGIERLFHLINIAVW